MMTTSKRTTCWKSIYLMTAISTFAGVQFSVFFTTLWPYLNTIDSNAGVVFSGIITAVFSAGQAFAAPLFGFWSNRVKSVKPPLILGVSTMIVANCLYCFAEAFETSHRRWAIFVARAFVGFGTGILGLMRTYASTASVLKDRSRAITLVTGSYVFGLTIGPGVQVALSPIGYPGVTFGVFHFDMFTAPAWFATFVNLISLATIITAFQENYVGIVDKTKESNSLPVLLKFDKLAVAICIGTQFALMLVVTNVETISTMYAMAMWNWTEKQAVHNLGLIQTLAGTMSLCSYVTFAIKIGPLLCNGKRERYGTIVGLFISFVFHILTYPYSFWPEKLDYKTILNEYRNITLVLNSTSNFENAASSLIQKTTGGCELYYSWCVDANRVPLLLYVGVYVGGLCIAVSIINICLNTLYSKILGPRRQGTMQGVLLLSGSIARTLGPVFVASSFEKFGPSVIWILEMTVIAVTLIVWLLFLPRMIPLGNYTQ